MANAPMFLITIVRLPVKALAAGRLMFTLAVLVTVKNAPPSALVSVMSVVVVVMLRYVGTPPDAVCQVGGAPDPFDTRTSPLLPAVVEVGEPPAPPPRTTPYCVSAPDDAHVLELEKYGTPPEEPATVKARVPLVVIGEPDAEINPPVKVWLTLETVAEEEAEFASNFTVPAEFLKYSFSSTVLSASSPATKLPAEGTAAAVLLK